MKPKYEKRDTNSEGALISVYDILLLKMLENEDKKKLCYKEGNSYILYVKINNKNKVKKDIKIKKNKFLKIEYIYDEENNIHRANKAYYITKHRYETQEDRMRYNLFVETNKGFCTEEDFVDIAAAYIVETTKIMMRAIAKRGNMRIEEIERYYQMELERYGDPNCKEMIFAKEMVDLVKEAHRKREEEGGNKENANQTQTKILQFPKDRIV